MALIDFDDIQAEENKRREAAVKAGASAVQTKYEDSPLKQLIKDYVEEASPSVSNEFKELVQNTALPGFNFVPPTVFNPSAEDIKKNAEELRKASDEEAETQARLQKEAKDNELKITSTSTGQPKVDKSGNVVEPLQSDSRDISETTNDGGTKSTNVVNPSPVGSGDARAAAAATDTAGGNTTAKK